MGLKAVVGGCWIIPCHNPFQSIQWSQWYPRACHPFKTKLLVILSTGLPITVIHWANELHKSFSLVSSLNKKHVGYLTTRRTGIHWATGPVTPMTCHLFRDFMPTCASHSRGPRSDTVTLLLSWLQADRRKGSVWTLREPRQREHPHSGPFLLVG